MYFALAQVVVTKILQPFVVLERGIQLFGQSYQKITMDLVGEIKSE
jgi:hypothetical protein